MATFLACVAIAWMVHHGRFGRQQRDAALVNLRGLRKLRVFDLSNTTVGDAGLAQLKVLTQQEQDMKTKNPFAVLAETNKRAFVSK